MSGNGSISADGPVEAGCTALALSDAVTAGVGLVSEPEELRQGAARATRIALDEIEGSEVNRVVMLFLDTRTGDQAEAVAGAYAAAGPQIPLVGGAAGGAEPVQIAGSSAVERSVVAVALSSPEPLAVGVAHGCRMVGTPSIVTGAAGRVVAELDGEPARAVFLRESGFHGDDPSDTEFEAFAVTHPLAQPELSGSERIRHVLGQEGDGLLCATHIPENAAVIFTEETPAQVVATAPQAVSEAVAGLGGARPAAALLFDCAGRKRAAGASVAEEVDSLLGAFGVDRPPLAGLFTHGEVARVRGAKGDRNHAIVVLAFG
ncbi:FIST C-terminal domain-containing protein [soil metagenome]